MKVAFICLLSFSFLIVSAQTIVIDKQQTGGTTVLYATSNEYCPVSIQLDLTMENLNSSSGEQSITVIPEKRKGLSSQN